VSDARPSTRLANAHRAADYRYDIVRSTGVAVSEYEEQCALFQWAAIKSRQIPELAYLFAIPNGGFRHKATAGRLKAQGLKAGVPDTFWPVPRGSYCGLWIEMKHGRNKPTREQIRWLRFLESQGYMVAVCYTWTEASDIVELYWNHGPQNS
jgi:hypothetical protein